MCNCSAAKNTKTQGIVLKTGVLDRLILLVHRAAQAAQAAVAQHDLDSLDVMPGLLEEDFGVLTPIFEEGGASASASAGFGGASASASAGFASAGFGGVSASASAGFGGASASASAGFASAAETFNLGFGQRAADAVAKEHQPTIFTCACGAMWAICALLMHNAEVQSRVCGLGSFLADLVQLFLHQEEEVQSASAWVVFNIAANSSSRVKEHLVNVHHVLQPLLQLMREGKSLSKGLAAQALRSVVFETPSAQRRAFELGALSSLYCLLSVDEPAVQAAGLWGIRTLCAKQADIQNAVRTSDGGIILAQVVSLLDSDKLQVWHQATNAISTIATHNRENQTQIVALEAMEKLIQLLAKCKTRAGGAEGAEAVLAALVSLCLKHSDNQSRFASTPHALGDLCFFLGLDRAVKTTLGIAAGLIRMITTNRPLVVLQLVACGAVAKLVAMCAEQESFAQEQAAAALYSLLSLSTEAVTLAHSFEAHTTLGNLVLAGSGSFSGPMKGRVVSDLALTCAIMSLIRMVEAVADADLASDLAAIPDMVPTLWRLRHESNPRSKLQPHAENLLSKLVPAQQVYNIKQTVASFLGSLLPVQGATTSAGGCGCGTGDRVLSCIICGEEHSSDKAGVFLPCFHYFHLECIRQWMETTTVTLPSGQKTCPTCKHDIYSAIQQLYSRR